MSVLLDIADARLREAVALESVDRQAEAGVAVSAYGEHVARAAEQLQDSPAAAVPATVERFRSVVAKQQATMSTGRTDARSGGALGFAAEMGTIFARPGTPQPHELAAAAASAADKAASQLEQKTAPILLSGRQSMPSTNSSATQPVSPSLVPVEGSPSSTPVTRAATRQATPAVSAQPVPAPTLQAPRGPGETATPAVTASSSITARSSAPASPGGTLATDATERPTTPVASGIAPARSTDSPPSTPSARSVRTSGPSQPSERSVAPATPARSADGKKDDDKKKVEAAVKAAREAAGRAKDAAERAKRTADKGSPHGKDRAK